jgi:hypothetical protein
MSGSNFEKGGRAHAISYGDHSSNSGYSDSTALVHMLASVQPLLKVRHVMQFIGLFGSGSKS